MRGVSMKRYDDHIFTVSIQCSRQKVAENGQTEWIKECLELMNI